MAITLDELERCLSDATREEFEAIRYSLEGDSRKGVERLLSRAQKKLEAQEAEQERLQSLYSFEARIAQEEGSHVVVGLDEVGRGPLAGPLAVGAVVLPSEPLIQGLNDSKQVSPEDRQRIAQQVKALSHAWTVQYIEPAEIDRMGITASLVEAFRRAVAEIESQGISCDLILLDGNPLRFDPRERNIVKGDSKCASIAAASIIAKVDRDELMEAYDELYPQYHFAQSKGYGSEAHRRAIEEHGLCPIHRASFCRAFIQESLF